MFEIISIIQVVLIFILLFIALIFCDEGTKISGICACLSLFLLFLLFYGMYKVDHIPWQRSELTATENIVALNDSQDINGNMYLRRGYITEELWYHYFVDIGDGFVANKVKSSGTTLYYAEGNYRVEWYKYYKNWLWFERTETRHKIYIPRGSITDDFILDLQ